MSKHDGVDLRLRAAYVNNASDFASMKGKDLLHRYAPYRQWVDDRIQAGVWPYARTLLHSAGPVATLRNLGGERASGINFASQDYLSLTKHPEVVEATVRAARDFGVHSAGSGMYSGNTRYSLDLQRGIAELLGYDHCILFPTGWGAGFGAISALVRPYDHIVMDALAHSCLQSGAEHATKHVYRHPHRDVAKAEAWLKRIRATDTENAILVITEGIFSMDADTGPIDRLQELCREYAAVLLADVAHDLGSWGPGGTGVIGHLDMLGKVDIVVGAFSKTFASNGGFVLCNSRDALAAMTVYGSPHCFSNALSPLQCATVNETLRIVRSPEGHRRRDQLQVNSRRLRSNLAAAGIDCLGETGAVNPASLDGEIVGRIATGLLWDRGLLANLAEYPAVPLGTSRFRLQLMSDHTLGDIDAGTEMIIRAVEDARKLVADSGLQQ